MFRSTSFQKGETELVIIVTPYLVTPAHRASSRHRWTNSHLRTGLAAPSGAS
nr:hypothetical protein [Pseudosulfitobacter pseudonitzschiae]